MSEFAGVDVRGTPARGLPQRPVAPDELHALLSKVAVSSIRVPKTGSEMLDDEPGPIVSGPDGTVSQFLLVPKQRSKVVEFQYGYPEVVKGELRVPKNSEQAKREGIIRWRKTVVDVEGVDEVLAESDVSTSSWWEFYEEQTVALQRS